jgi:hypothetical protein
VVSPQQRALVADFGSHEFASYAQTEKRLVSQGELLLTEKNVLQSQSLRQAVKSASVREVRDRLLRPA